MGDDTRPVMQVQYLDGIAVVRVAGAVTAGRSSSALGRGIAEALKRGHTRLVLNLSESSSIDSAGLGELVSGMKQCVAAGGRMAVIANSEVRQSLARLHLDRVLELMDSEEEAVAALAQSPGP